MINEIHITEEGRVTVVVQEEATEILVTDLPGRSGTDGISAYQVAVNNGYTGTEAEWLDDLIIDSGEFADGVWSLLLPGTGMVLDRDPTTKVITIRGTGEIPFDNTDSGLIAETLGTAINELADRTKEVAPIGLPPTFVGEAVTSGYRSSVTPTNVPPHEAGDILVAVTGSRMPTNTTSGWYDLYNHTNDAAYGGGYSSALWRYGPGGSSSVTLNHQWSDHLGVLIFALRAPDINVEMVEHLHTGPSQVSSAIADTGDASSYIFIAANGESREFPGMPPGLTAMGSGFSDWYQKVAVFSGQPMEDRTLPSYTFTNTLHLSVLKVTSSLGPTTEEQVASIEGRVTSVEDRVSTLEAEPSPVLLLEAGQTEANVPPGTPIGTIIFRKV